MKLKTKQISVLFISFFVLTGCSNFGGTVVATYDEISICAQVKKTWEEFNSQDNDNNEKVILSIKKLGSRWTQTEYPNLNGALRDISEYNLTENLKENYREQRSRYVLESATVDLFYKYLAVNNACNDLTNNEEPLLGIELTDEEIDKVFKNILVGTLTFMNSESNLVAGLE
jgi:hypothetical protein